MDRFTSDVRVQIGPSYFECRLWYESRSFSLGFRPQVSFASCSCHSWFWMNKTQGRHEKAPGSSCFSNDISAEYNKLDD